MSIIVESVSKLYGKQKALDNVSFNVKKGEVVGFLGPNGAGKSTMMKIITCYIPQSLGMVSVCGFDVATQSMEVKKRVGYLPENNPLYFDMYIKEYLSFIAGVHKLGNSTKSRIDYIIEKTGLLPEIHKKLGVLSKGYRQRVGIAQALIHDPEVIILDEPTSGLDPNQIVDIRNLISEIGKEKTILLSTHIMQEVEAMCNRVIIVNKGKIVADAPTEQMQAFSNLNKTVFVEFEQKIDSMVLKAIEGVTNVVQDGNKYKVFTNTDKDIRPEIFKISSANNWVILTIGVEEQSLEEVFRQLTSVKS
ncbi:MAG: gliding motility-associated ABC transporter ATP-binding subunit GldA [Bacteroidetes bacterium]|nr:gliding motility-associated ABC transporter ATP-binding subunit GldA [Bacteroidota bacterium]